MIETALRQFFVNFSVKPSGLVAAVSGGADSTALLLALAELRHEGFELACAHVNHRLRGAESDGDELFVREWCARLDVPLHVADGTLDPDRVRERGIEAAAREVRYARLAEIRERCGARFVATAHQQNDQAETVLMRLLSGSGIGGLRGIHPVREDGFIRPLLDVTRDEVEAFLRERNVTPRVDRSNGDPRFVRNRVRALLRELGGIEHLASIATQTRSLWPLLERSIDAAEQVEVNADSTRFLTLPDDAWLRGALLQRHIRRLDPDARDFDAQRIASELERTTRLTVTRNVELVRDGGGIALRRIAPPSRVPGFEVEVGPDAAAVLIQELGVSVRVSRVLGNRNAERGTQSGESRTGAADMRRRVSQLIQLPAGASATFTVRNRRSGDRFQPLGMSSSKKLKDFLIDRKIAAAVRDRLPLLVWNGDIVWIAGVEVSERFKVTAAAAGELYEVTIES